jgi:hypothetical protein
MRAKQFGGFLGSILGVAAVVIVIGLLATQFFQRKKLNEHVSNVAKIEAEKMTGVVSGAGALAAVAVATSTEPKNARAIGHGLTFVLPFVDGKTPQEAVELSCHGEPRPTDKPNKNSCNPYQGDTSCRAVLPVLCFKSGGMLAGTSPTMGYLLDSEADASARCAKEFGTGWRMAEFHDGGGWALKGQKGPGLITDARYWVHINDQPANCWNNAE